MFMCEKSFQELKTIDRDALIGMFVKELPHISGEMGTTPRGIAYRVGMDKDRMQLIVSGRRKMKWSEYMSVLFVLWNDDIGRKMIEEKNLFPDILKNAMKVK